MKRTRILVMLAALLAFGAIAAAPASATTVGECQAKLATLRSDTVGAQSSFTNQKVVAGRLGKLDAAAAKLSQGKNADAIQKLVDFQTTLNALASAAKPKVDPALPKRLSAEAQGVIDCISAIGT